MTSMQPLWWLALPVLLLPLWWHLRKRERTRSEILATARFLPAATPQQQRVPRWRDVLLLLVRLALLLALIAWLAVLAMPWKGDTVLLDPALEHEPWAAQQIKAAGMSGAERIALPPDVWSWLARNEHEWSPGARFLVLARSVPMPALAPRLAHAVQVQLAPAAKVPAAAPRERHVVVVAPPERMARWRALFAAFDTAGASRYVVGDTPTPATQLIVWDRPDATPPLAWQAPLWWRTDQPQAGKGGAAPAAAKSPQGMVWHAPQWPLDDLDGARALYEAWQQALGQPDAYPLPAQAFPAARKSPLPAPLARSPEWLALALLALFAMERMLAHARRR